MTQAEEARKKKETDEGEAVVKRKELDDLVAKV